MEVLNAIPRAARVDLQHLLEIAKESWMDLPCLLRMRNISSATTDPNQIGYLSHTPPSFTRTILLASTIFPWMCDGMPSWTPPENEFTNLLI